LRNVRRFIVVVIADWTPRVTLSSSPLEGLALSPAAARLFLVNNISLLLDLSCARALRAIAERRAPAPACPAQTFVVS
jgi:hypothetical protein